MTNTADKKTAEEIFGKVNGFSLIGDNETISLTKRNIFEAMEEYANQFKYDYSMECKCGDSSPGETWCCNHCGLPTPSAAHTDTANCVQCDKDFKLSDNWIVCPECHLKSLPKEAAHTKGEEAIAFVEWIDFEGWKSNGEFWYNKHDVIDDRRLTASQLFDLFINHPQP